MRTEGKKAKRAKEKRERRENSQGKDREKNQKEKTVASRRAPPRKQTHHKHTNTHENTSPTGDTNHARYILPPLRKIQSSESAMEKKKFHQFSKSSARYSSRYWEVVPILVIQSFSRSPNVLLLSYSCDHGRRCRPHSRPPSPPIPIIARIPFLPPYERICPQILQCVIVITTLLKPREMPESCVKMHLTSPRGKK